MSHRAYTCNRHQNALQNPPTDTGSKGPAIVWVKYGNSPWWPAFVDKPLREHLEAKPARELGGKEPVFVVFFGPTKSHAWVGADCVVPFAQGREEFAGKCKRPGFKIALRQAEKGLRKNDEEEEEEEGAGVVSSGDTALAACECCGLAHDGRYGPGRFCSAACRYKHTGVEITRIKSLPASSSSSSSSSSSASPLSSSASKTKLHKSAFKGVFKARSGGNWYATISISGKGEYLGRYTTEDEAARAYDERATALGRPLNFPDATATQADTGPVAKKKKPVYLLSEFKGVHGDSGKWESNISISGSKVYLGRYTTEDEAARAYDERASTLGRPLNFPGATALQGAARKTLSKKNRRVGNGDDPSLVDDGDSGGSGGGDSKAKKLVWVKHGNSPWWPAWVDKPRREHLEAKPARRLGGKEPVFVVFFGQTISHAWVGADCVVPFAQGRQEFSGKCKKSGFKSALRQAEEGLRKNGEEEEEEEEESGVVASGDTALAACECCGLAHDGRYGPGRFCSAACRYKHTGAEIKRIKSLPASGSASSSSSASSSEEEEEEEEDDGGGGSEDGDNESDSECGEDAVTLVWAKYATSPWWPAWVGEPLAEHLEKKPPPTFTHPPAPSPSSSSSSSSSSSEPSSLEPVFVVFFGPHPSCAWVGHSAQVPFSSGRAVYGGKCGTSAFRQALKQADQGVAEQTTEGQRRRGEAGGQTEKKRRREETKKRGGQKEMPSKRFEEASVEMPTKKIKAATAATAANEEEQASSSSSSSSSSVALCEVCRCKHDALYGAGRFCSSSCKSKHANSGRADRSSSSSSNNSSNAHGSTKKGVPEGPEKAKRVAPAKTTPPQGQLPTTKTATAATASASASSPGAVEVVWAKLSFHSPWWPAWLGSPRQEHLDLKPVSSAAAAAAKKKADKADRGGVVGVNRVRVIPLKKKKVEPNNSGTGGSSGSGSKEEEEEEEEEEEGAEEVAEEEPVFVVFFGHKPTSGWVGASQVAPFSSSKSGAERGDKLPSFLKQKSFAKGKCYKSTNFKVALKQAEEEHRAGDAENGPSERKTAAATATAVKGAAAVAAAVAAASAAESNLGTAGGDAGTDDGGQRSGEEEEEGGEGDNDGGCFGLTSSSSSSSSSPNQMAKNQLKKTTTRKTSTKTKKALEVESNKRGRAEENEDDENENEMERGEEEEEEEEEEGEEVVGHEEDEEEEEEEEEGAPLSGFFGVRWLKRKKAWAATLLLPNTRDGGDCGGSSSSSEGTKIERLGTFSTAVEAACAYDKRATELRMDADDRGGSGGGGGGGGGDGDGVSRSPLPPLNFPFGFLLAPQISTHAPSTSTAATSTAATAVEAAANAQGFHHHTSSNSDHHAIAPAAAISSLAATAALTTGVGGAREELLWSNGGAKGGALVSTSSSSSSSTSSSSATFSFSVGDGRACHSPSNLRPAVGISPPPTPPTPLYTQATRPWRAHAGSPFLSTASVSASRQFADL